MINRKQAFHVLISLLICILTHAIILGISSDFFHNQKEYIQNNWITYFKWIYYAFVYITLYGYWILYLPFFVIFYKLRIRFNTILPIYWGLLGAALGCVYVLPGLLILYNSNWDWLYRFPSYSQWMTLPTASIIGGVYGLFEGYWIANNQPTEAD